MGRGDAGVWAGGGRLRHATPTLTVFVFFFRPGLSLDVEGDGGVSEEVADAERLAFDALRLLRT